MHLKSNTYYSINYPPTQSAFLEHQRRAVRTFPPVGVGIVMVAFVYLMDNQLDALDVIIMMFTGYLLSSLYAWYTMDTVMVKAEVTPYGANIYSLQSVVKRGPNGLVYPVTDVKKQSYGADVILNNEITVLKRKEWPEFDELIQDLKLLAESGR